MTPQFEWDDDSTFPRGVDVFVGASKLPGVVHSRSLTANGTYIYGVRLKGDAAERSVKRRGNQDVDCYCEASDMESLLI